jgi:hypothetical protein
MTMGKPDTLEKINCKSVIKKTVINEHLNKHINKINMKIIRGLRNAHLLVVKLVAMLVLTIEQTLYELHYNQQMHIKF